MIVNEKFKKKKSEFTSKTTTKTLFYANHLKNFKPYLYF